ncbi:SGNH/GDSL hydrolase family protein [Lentilactobacillus sp. Marseille-Q4993]|uniref:SGNH/GDSL hydrolase family protein n=1 Tax=Lentilactobacillus sp. Marseille-Q4993 TaxID=3039492 RepID=UPI0024BD216B|nr:SGNH/GDSL hydrolase family protein [Lentilactobacillus sp. Marseille-Q4993]
MTEVNAKLTGKTLYAFGTSIVNGHLANTSFVEDICNANNIKYQKFCVNGAASRITDPNNIIDQIKNAPKEVPDFIVFDSIANDAYATVTDDPDTMGKITYGFENELDPKTYCGALETICKMLETKYQGAKILYLATHKTPARDLRVQNIMHAVSLKIVHKWSIKVADLYTEGNFNGFLKQYQHDYSYDKVDENGSNHSVGGTGTHPNADGYRLFYDPIITQGLVGLASETD